jgi:hypothetical protein
MLNRDKFKKITFSIPPQFADDLDFLSSRLKITRSAMLTSIAADATHDLRDLVSSVPENPTPEDLLHAKGRSQALIDDRIESAKGLNHDLFSE